MSSLFLKLIQPFPIESPFEISNNDLSDIKSEGLNHNLLTLLYTQLQKYQHIISPEIIVSNFLNESKSLYLKSVILSIQQEVVEKEISSLLREKGIPSIVIKGNKIARAIYNDPNCRTSSDIDILIRRSDALQMHEILLNAGYTNDIKLPIKYCFYRLQEAKYYHPGNLIPIDMHWSFGMPYFFKLSSEEIWGKVTFTNSGYFDLSPELLIIMLLIHHYSHSFRELKILVDIFWSLYKYDNEIDWYEFAKGLRKIGFLKSTQIILSQVQSLWKETAEEMKSVQILQQEIERMGYKVPGFLLSYFQMDSNKKYHSEIYKDKLIARLTLDKWSTIILSYFKTLFPVPEAVKEIYSSKSNWTLPYNYLRFIKWRVREWTGKSS